jgi:mono/diheme cytochrome c family protein
MKRRSIVQILVIVVIVAGALAISAAMFFVIVGVSARPEPSRLEQVLARTVRRIAIGRHARHEANPVPKTDEAIAGGRAHFADHCASCHGNDGSGNTEMGRGLYPRAPDMRLAATQDLDDFELFYIIENGIRLTGMPAWGTGTTAGIEESWKLVHFIRHLPQLTTEEIEQMEALNPKAPDEIRQEIEAERFLRGEDPSLDANREETQEKRHAH